MRDAILLFLEEYGNIAVFLLILAENLFPPIPSEVILTVGGAMTAATGLTVPGVVAAATAGSVLGAVILYLAGSILSAEKMEQLVSGPVGRALRFDPEDIRAASGWFAKKGRAAVFLCRLVPIVRSLISIPAGMAAMPMGPFLLLTVSGSLIWNTILVLLGRAAGNSWEKVEQAYGLYSDLFLMAAGTVILLVLLFRRGKTDKKFE